MPPGATAPPPTAATAATANSQIDSMVHQVLEVFPGTSEAAVRTDLQLTRSIHLTIDNIIQGALAQPIVQPADRSGGTDTPVQSTETNMQSSFPDAGGDNNVRSRRPSQPAAQNSGIDHGPAQNSGIDQAPAQDSGIDQAPAGGGDLLTPTSEVQQPADEVVLPSPGANQFVGGRFSKASSERQTMLEDRKNTLIEAARKRYRASHTKEESASSSTSLNNTHLETNQPISTSIAGDVTGTSGAVLRQRRELAFQAALRRMQGTDQSSSDSS
jgi:hypothetical protein